MRQLSTDNVTQQDPAANPQNAATVRHITGMSALHAGYKSKDYEKLSTGARALFTFICVKSGKYGCVFFRLDKIAKFTGLNRRILCLKRKELEDLGWIHTEYVPRGEPLPSKQIATRQTAVFRALGPPPTSSPEKPINDPAMLINDPGINDRGVQTPFCDLLDLEEDPDVGKQPQTKRAPPPIEEGTITPLAQRILQQWRNRLMPTQNLDLFGGSWEEIIKARLREGFTEAECFAAIEEHYWSPHNRPHARRTLHHVFGDHERLRTMADLGAARPPAPQNLKKTRPPPSPPARWAIPDDLTAEEAQAVMDKLNEEPTTEVSDG